MISEELLSEVLGIKVEITGKLSNSNICYTDKYFNDDDINIHELSHKCKEWAFNKGYTILTYPKRSELINRKSLKVVNICYNTNFENHKVYNPNMDIELCQWILDNKEK